MKRWLWLGIILFPILANATDYYVDSSCTDTNVGSAVVDGTTYNPAGPACTGGAANYYTTITDLNAKTFVPGDRIYFRKGKTWTISSRWTFLGDGTSDVHITIDAFGSGTLPTIDGGGVANNIITVSGKSWLDFSNLILQNASGSNLQLTSGAHDITVTGVTSKGSTGGHGVYTDGYNLTFTNDDIYSNGLDSSNHNIYVDNCSGIAGTVVIDGCRLHDPSGSNVKVNSCNVGRLAGIAVRDSLLYNAGDDSNDIDDYASEGAIYEYNIFYPSTTHDAQAIRFSSNTVAPGTFNARNGVVRNNTIHHRGLGYYALDILQAGNVGFTIKNNIFFVDVGSYISGNASPTAITASENNIFYGGTASWKSNGTTYSTLAAWQGAGFDTTNSVVTDPRFVNVGGHDYTLMSWSPAIDLGATLSQTRDYVGNGRSGSYWDVGAIEFQQVHGHLASGAVLANGSTLTE